MYGRPSASNPCPLKYQNVMSWQPGDVSSIRVSIARMICRKSYLFMAFNGTCSFGAYSHCYLSKVAAVCIANMSSSWRGGPAKLACCVSMQDLEVQLSELLGHRLSIWCSVVQPRKVLILIIADRHRQSHLLDLLQHAYWWLPFGGSRG